MGAATRLRTVRNVLIICIPARPSTPKLPPGVVHCVSPFAARFNNNYDIIDQPFFFLLDPKNRAVSRTNNGDNNDTAGGTGK